MKMLQQYLLTAALVAVSSGIRAGETEQRFDIAAQDLGPALQKLAAQSGVSVFYASDSVAGRKAPALKGQYSTSAALIQLLSGSGLTYSLSGDGSISVKPMSEQLNKADPTTLKPVNVTAKANRDVTDPYNPDYVLPNATAGTKTDTPIMETPLNVQVVSKQVLKDQQVISLADALQNVSGVVVSSQMASNGSYGNAGGSQSDITLRGFAASTYFRNGFRLQQGSRPMSNVESVEVLKGPAAILYGMVEPGGMVNVTTKQPQATPYYALNQQFGSYNNYRTTADATGPVAGNKDVLYRMNMSYQNSGSWQDYVSNDDLFLAPVLKWNISPKTQATVEFEYNRQNQSPPSSTNPYIAGQLLHNPLSTNYGQYSPVATETFFGSMSWSHQFNDDWSIKNRILANQQSDKAPNINVQAYSLHGDPLGISAPYSDNILRENVANSNQNNTYSTNLDLTGHFDTLGLKHTLLLGGDYYRLDHTNAFDNRNCPTCALGPLTIVSAYNPTNPGIALDVPNGFTSSNQQQTDQYGLYGQDQIKLPYNVHVTGGLRYQYLHQITQQTNDSVPGQANALTQDAVTPRVGILWHPQNWVSLYANYAESFGANTGLVWNSQSSTTPIQATSASQYEGGVKTEFFGGRLRGTLAYYDLSKTNIATGDPVITHACGGGLPGQSCSIAVGEVHSRGPELDIQGEILPGWNAIATWSNVDILISKGTPSPTLGYQVGDRLVGVPRNTVSFWNTYEFQNAGLKGFKFGGGITARDAQISPGGVDLSGNSLSTTKTGGYATLNLMTAYSRAIGKSKVTVQLNINNLLDKRYFTQTYGGTLDPLGVSMGGSTYGAPRTVMGSISIQY